MKTMSCLHGLGLLLIACFSPGPAAAQQTDADLERKPSLTVSGHGEITVRPDRAAVRLGVEAQAETAAAAQEAVNASMQKVLQELKKLGIPEREIQTASINLSPVYEPPRPLQETNPPEVVGYRAANVLQINLHDVKLVGPTIDAGLSNGANRLEGVSFELADELQARTSALKEAVEEAKTKARTLADALNLKLGDIKTVNEGSVNVQRPQMALAHAARSAMAATPIEAGEITVEAVVNVQFAIAPGENEASGRP